MTIEESPRSPNNATPGRRAPLRGAGPEAVSEAEAEAVELGADGITPLWNGYVDERDKELRRMYGLTLAQYDKILTVQGGVCGVCGHPPAGKRAMDVDHDHDTNEIRGLLHHRCNQAIWVTIARYLKDPPARQVGPFFIPASRLEVQAKRSAAQAARQRQRRAAKRKEEADTPAAEESYADKVAAALASSTVHTNGERHG